MLEPKPTGNTFEVWELASRNIVGEFATEREALALVRALAEEGGRDGADAFALVREDEHGDSVTIAMGASLIERALRSQPRSSASRV